MVSSKVGRIIMAALAAAALFIVPVAAQKTGSITVTTVIDRSGPPELDANGNPVPGTGAIKNPCTGEDVNILGTMTTTTFQTLDNQGFIRTDITVVSKGTGTGVVTGTLYPFSESQSISAKDDTLTVAFVSTFSDKIGLRGPKSIDNWVARATFKVTILSDGTVKSELTKLSGDVCKG